MGLIKKIYENKNENSDIERGPILLFSDEESIRKLVSFLESVRCFDTDLSYSQVNYNLVEVFKRLGIGVNGSIFLNTMKIYSSRYRSSQGGVCSFNYSVGTDDYNTEDSITYYSSCELFPASERYSIYPGIKISDGNTSLYYSVGTVPQIRQYDIKINEDITLSREYSKDEVFFIFEDEMSRFIIKIKKPISKVVGTNYELDNEFMLVEYLRSLSYPYDISEIYNKLYEISLGNNISEYPEITLCESSKENEKWKDINLISIKNGDIDSIVRTIGDKVITCYGNGNWNYVISDENVTFTINSGKTLRYGIEAKDNMVMDDYTDSLLKYDVSTARREVEDTKKLVREKLSLDGKRKR